MARPSRRLLPLAALLWAAAAGGQSFFNVEREREAAPGPADTDYFTGKERGWFWYEREPEPAPEEEEASAPPPPPAPEPASPAARPAPPEPAPLSAAWFRQNMEKYRDRALDEPTPGNVAAYYALQRVMLDKASRFTDMAGQVSLSEPMLDENLLRPTASFGALAMDDRAVRATDGAARKLAAMAGLWFVYESTCPFCEKQAGPLKGLANAHGFKILPIALDGLPLPGNPFPDFVPDRGQARRLGADTTPALFLVRPGPGGGVLPLGQGLLSGDEIVRRAIALARQKG